MIRVPNLCAVQALCRSGELGFTHPAERANPIFWNVLKGRSRFNTAVRIPKSRIIDITAYLAHIFLHDKLLVSILPISSVLCKYAYSNPNGRGLKRGGAVRGLCGTTPRKRAAPRTAASRLPLWNSAAARRKRGDRGPFNSRLHTPIANNPRGERGDRGAWAPRRGRGGGTPAAAHCSG